MDQEHFAAWVLLLQIAAYINFLDFGIQTAVARFVAQAVERQDPRERDSYVSTAAVMLSCAAILAFVVICMMAWLIPSLFRQAPLHVLPEMRRALILLGAFSAVALPFSTFTGVFVGLRRNEYPAVVTGASKLAGAALVVLAVRHGSSLVVMAAMIGATSLLGGVWQYAHLRKLLPDLKISTRLISRHFLRNLLHFCAGLSVWSFAGFLIGGLDLTIVGYFDFAGVADYSLASNAVLLVAGLCTAATNALIAPYAAIHARGEYERLGRLVIRATGALTQLLIIVSFPFFLFGTRLLTVWVGSAYAQGTLPILEVLLLANVIRMVAAPYAAAQVGAGEHVRVMYSPLFEAFINLSVSIVACQKMGPIGVAVGTLVGSIAGNGLQIFYNIPKIKEIRLGRRALLLEGVFWPIACVFPALAGISVAVLLPSIFLAARIAIGTAGVIAAILLMRRCLTAPSMT